MAADDRRPHLTGQEVDLERVMREVVARVQDAGFVLKGGGALVLVYGSIRHTTDLDFDAERPTDMTRRIRRAAQAAGVEIDPETWWWPKGAKAGRDSRRYRVWCYGSQGERLRLQVDTRYRPKPRFSDVTVVDGIRTYKPEALYDQKIAAFRGRNAARDLFDLAFLSKRHGDILTDAQISEAEAITRDMNRLEREVAVKLRDDRILARITTAEDIVYEFRDAVEEQLERRKMKMQVVEQRVLISPSMTREIIELRRLLHGGDEAGKPNDSESLSRAPRSGPDRSDAGRSAAPPPGGVRSLIWSHAANGWSGCRRAGARTVLCADCQRSASTRRIDFAGLAVRVHQLEWRTSTRYAGPADCWR